MILTDGQGADRALRRARPRRVEVPRAGVSQRSAGRVREGLTPSEAASTDGRRGAGRREQARPPRDVATRRNRTRRVAAATNGKLRDMVVTPETRPRRLRVDRSGNGEMFAARHHQHLRYVKERRRVGLYAGRSMVRRRDRRGGNEQRRRAQSREPPPLGPGGAERRPPEATCDVGARVAVGPRLREMLNAARSRTRHRRQGGRPRRRSLLSRAERHARPAHWPAALGDPSELISLGSELSR